MCNQRNEIIGGKMLLMGLLYITIAFNYLKLCILHKIVEELNLIKSLNAEVLNVGSLMPTFINEVNGIITSL